MNKLSTLLVFCLIFLSIPIVVTSQTYNMTDGMTTTTCGGTFYDTGGPNGDYDNNENIVHTFCSDDPTECIRFDFESTGFALFVDNLFVYDGTSTSDTYLGDATNKKVFVATSGCLTFEFMSDGLFRENGWEAAISCVTCPLPANQSQQDCLGAIPVCQDTYSQPNSYSGPGSNDDEISIADYLCLEEGEKNSVWYVFNVQETGDLSFLITPTDPCDDYDWGVWDITDLDACYQINNNPDVLLSCSYANSKTNPISIINNCLLNPLVDDGATGASSANGGTGNSAAREDDPYNADITVEVGRTYVLLVSNFTSSQSGYDLDFSSSTATIFDDTAPEIQQILNTPLTCNETEINIEFSEPIVCSSIQPEDFQVTQPDGTQLNVLALETSTCNDEDFIKTITIVTDPLTQGGIHTLGLMGMLEDNCGNILTDTSIDFSVETIDVDAGEDITFCNGETPNVLGGNPTSSTANQYTWTSDPASATTFISATNVANPTIVNQQNMPAGTYNFYVEAALNSCTAADTIIVIVEEFSISNISSPTAAMCNEANGEAVVELIGGTAPFNYNWEDAANVGVTVSTDSLAMGLSPGIYNVTVTDSGGCEATESVSVSNLPGPTLSSPDSEPATCNMSDGQASVVVNGGTPPYIFSWENVNTPGMVISTDSVATGLAPGGYTVTVNNKDGSCPISLSLTVNEGTCCNITVDNTEVEDATCGMDNGTVTLTLSNISISSLEWENVLNPGASVAMGNVASGLPAGTYSYTITDNNNCEYMGEVTIEGSTNPVISMPMPVNSTCGLPNGTASFSVDGGTYPYFYNWEDTANPGTTISTDSLAIGLVGSTTYNVTVTDDTGCTDIGMINLTNTPGPEITDVTEISANCSSADGTASIDINAGAGQQTFVWEDAMGNEVSTNQVAMNLPSGAYTVTVTDTNGCTDTATANINDVDGPMISNPTPTPTQCGSSNGTASVTVTGGVWEYNFSWENSMGMQVSTDSVATGLTADTYTVTVMDKNNCGDNETIEITDTPGPTLGNLEESAPPCPGDDGMAVITLNGGALPYSNEFGLTFTSPFEITASPGTYDITFTDANNCPITVDYVIPSAQAIILSPTSEDTTCGEDNGSITINVSGGINPPYQYSLDGITFQTDNVFSNLSAGDYIITVQGNVCSITANLPTTITSSTELSIMINEKNATCGDADGEATVDVIQGMGTAYAWENAANPGTVISTDAMIAGLSSGTYNVTVTDGTNCTATATANISDEGGPVIGEPIVSDANCDDMDGSIEISVTGGMPGYVFEWEDADNPGVIIGADNVITGLSGGTYNVVVSDANNCAASSSSIINEPGNPVISINKNDPFCDNNDGFIEITVTEGTPNYIYEWENAEEPGVTISISNILNNLSDGTYNLTVTDDVGCIATEMITLDSMEIPVIWGTNVVSNATCGQEDGSAFVGVNGVEPLTYQWENVAYPGDIVGNAATATELVSGNYIVVVTDANGCTATSPTVSIGDEGGPEIRAEGIDATCGQANGSAVIIVDSGIPDFSYNWENILNPGVSISINDTINNLGEGDYNVTVTDGNGCMGFGSVTIESTAGIIFDMPSVEQPSCAGADGTITLNPVGGSYYYTYQWSNGNDQQVGVNLTAGTYTITVTDDAGCSATTGVELIGADAILFDIMPTDAGCSGSNDGSITIDNVSGGSGAPYTYSVDGFSFSSETIFEDLSPGMYDVIVQDADNCQAINSVEIGAASVLEMDYGDDEEIELGESVDLLPATNFPLDESLYTWTWSEDSTLIFNGFSYNPTAQPTTTTTYVVTVADTSGCSVTDMITIRINQNREVYIPNAFSPNFDGQNDIFMVYGGIGVAQVRTMQIYDRWGGMVFEGNNFSTDNPVFGWDGQYRDSQLNPGVYVYYIEIDFTDGTSDSYRGDVTLVK